MIRYSFLILCALLCLLPATAAGGVKLQGTVTDAETGEPVAGAIVKAGKSFTSTGREGRFTLTPKVDADSVSFKSIGYEALTLPIDADMSDVRLVRKATQLNDVIVEAPDIYARGDTLVFNVSRYANAKDNAIIDVIKRLPGIKVEEDGTIKYQGKPINKFYLDGNDFIGGQYGLATNNISHKDVKAVEVMENHQPVKALEGIEFPDEAGINLKLKDDARSRWVGVANASAGVEPLLYNGSVFAMRIAPKIQNIFTLKADNTGWNPADEISEHDFDMMFGSEYSSSLWPEYISADMESSPLSEKRTRDNLSWLADAITAWKSGDTSMRLKLDYMGDRLDYNSGVNTQYIDSDIPDFSQQSDMRTQRHDISAQFYSVTNKQGYYLKDKLTLAAGFDKASSEITGSLTLGQKVRRKRLSATNDLRLVKRNEKRLFTLTSRNSFSRRPDLLEIFGDETASQSVGTSDFRSTTESQFGKMTRFWKYFLDVGIDLNYHRMHTSLEGMPGYDNSGIYDCFLSSVYATPRIDYERNGWRLSLKSAIKWLHNSLRGNHDHVNVSPQFNVRRQLTAKSELSASVSYRLSSPQPYLNIDAPVLSDYHNLFIGNNPDRYSHGASASLSYQFKNPMKSVFVNASATYNYTRLSAMRNLLYCDDLVVTTYSGRYSDSNTLSVHGEISKGLGHSKMVVGCEVNGSATTASSMRDNELIPYRSTSVGIAPFFRGSLLKWLSLNYEADYNFTTMKVGNDLNRHHMFTHKLFATVIPSDPVQLSEGAEQYVTRFPEGNTANMVLLDASAVWRVNGRIRLSLTANNLLNSRRYEYMQYGALSQSEYSFRIRPRNIIATIQYRF